MNQLPCLKTEILVRIRFQVESGADADKGRCYEIIAVGRSRHH